MPSRFDQRRMSRTLEMNLRPAPRRAAWALALRDLTDGFRSTRVWAMLAWFETRQRYKRSTLGPFWLTISTGALVAGMGPLYGRLFGQELGAYFPFLAIGFIVWQLISSLINEAGQVFIAAEPYIKQIRLPFTLHVLQMIWRNLLIFAHNFVIAIVVLLWFPPAQLWPPLLALPGLLLVLLNGLWAGLLLGTLCARYRDIAPIVSSVVQLAFFLTPILWKREMLGSHQWAVDANPLYHMVELVRAPLLGEVPPAASWLIVMLITAGGFALALLAFARYRARIAYWV